MIELDNEVDHLRALLLEKDRANAELCEQIRQLKLELDGNQSQRESITSAGGLRQEHEKLQLYTLEEISKLEANIKFKDVELFDLSQEIVNLRQQKNMQIAQLQDQLDEYKQMYSK